MNRYKIKPGTTIQDIISFGEENKAKYNFGTGGSWIFKNADYYFIIPLCDDISLDIAFPNDLNNWDDYDYVLVLDEMFGQPYTPFYYKLKNPKEVPGNFLQTIINKYNEKMNELPFLARIDDSL